MECRRGSRIGFISGIGNRLKPERLNGAPNVLLDPQCYTEFRPRVWLQPVVDFSKKCHTESSRFTLACPPPLLRSFSDS